MDNLGFNHNRSLANQLSLPASLMNVLSSHNLVPRLFQVSGRGLVEPHQRDRRSEMDGHRDSLDLDTVRCLGDTGGHRFRHDHHGLQRRTLEDLFAAPHAKKPIHECELLIF